MIGLLQLEQQEEHPKGCEDLHSLWREGPSALFPLNTWKGKGQLDCSCPKKL